MKENNQNHQPMDQRGRQYTFNKDLKVVDDMLHTNDAASLRTTLSRTYGVYKLFHVVVACVFL